MKIGIRLRAVLAGSAVALAAIGFSSLGTSVSVHAAPPTAPGTCETTATGGAPLTGAGLDCTFSTAIPVSGTAGAGGSIQETLLNGATFTPGVFMINGVAVALSPTGVINNPAGPGGGCVFNNTGIQLTINCNTGAAVNPIPAGTNITLSLTTPQGVGSQISMNDVEQTSTTSGPLNRTLTFLPAIGSGVAAAPAVTCIPNGNVPVGTSTQCTIGTTSVVQGFGGTVSITIASPQPGATITSCTTAAGSGFTCGATGAGTITVTCNLLAAVNCAANPNAIVLTVTSSTAGPLAFNFAITNPVGGGAGTNFNGVAPVPPVNFTALTPASITESCNNNTPTTGTGPGASTVCTVTLTGPLANGSTIVKTITAPAGAYAMTCTTAVAVAGTGACTTTGTAAGGTAAPAGAGSVVTFTCTTVAGCAGGSTFSFTVTGATTPGAMTQTAAIAGGFPAALVPASGVVSFGTAAPAGLSMQLGCASGSATTGFPVNTTGVLGTNNSQALANTIVFGMSANGQLSLQQLGANSIAGLSVLAPLGLAYNPSFGVNLGGGVFPNGIGGVGVPAVFCDVAITDLAGGPDGIPGTVPEGSIQYSLSGSDLAVITLTNTITASVQCNTGATPIEGCIGAGIPGSSTVPPAPATTGTATVVPNAQNGVFVALNSGVSFSLFGAGTPTITLTATYTANPTVVANLTTTATTTIPLITPSYSMYIVTSPGATVATGTPGTGVTVTAQLYHFATGNCVPLTNYPTGITLGGTAVPYLICGTTAQLLNVPATTAPSYLIPGAEPGLITFTTTQGYFATVTGTTTASPSAGQSVTVQCGALPTGIPNILTPSFAIGQSYNISTCLTASVTLLGGGSVGNATVVANYVGQITGATAQAVGVVTFTPTPASAQLTRGCNEVVLNAGNGLTSAQVLALANPTASVVSIWQFNNSLHAFQALYFNTAGAPTDISSIGAGSQSVFYCVSNSTSVTTGF